MTNILPQFWWFVINRDKISIPRWIEGRARGTMELGYDVKLVHEKIHFRTCDCNRVFLLAPIEIIKSNQTIFSLPSYLVMGAPRTSTR
jgi:hypothetical protein